MDNPSPSRLPRYLRGTVPLAQLSELELRSEPKRQNAASSSDEGFQATPGQTPPRDHSKRLRPRSTSHQRLQEITNVVILKRCPTAACGSVDFARDCLINAEIDDKSVEVKLSKLSDTVFIYNLSSGGQILLASFIEKSFPTVKTEQTIGIPPYNYKEDFTGMIEEILKNKGTEQIAYNEINDWSRNAFLLLLEDIPFDTNRLVEVNQGGFHGLRLKIIARTKKLDTRHLMCLISVRSLAPLVHGMISTEPRLLDRGFLESLLGVIEANASEILGSAIVAAAVDGEAMKKPLEHLVTCVPGVEVVWTDNQKVIRKLELPERAGVEPNARGLAAANGSPDAQRLEQDIVKVLSDVLKQPLNLYMSMKELEDALKELDIKVGRSLRQFITERPKHFQILGEGSYEVVTLSHRAQIKRVCNDLQKVLRPLKPKCISSVDIATAFARHWQTTNDAERSDRTFSVEDFGVCYLDDLLVTIPQHWGVHCSSYVSTDGEQMTRSYGEGEEDIPEFVPRTSPNQVFAWIPRHHQTEAQKKSMALLRQQVLNMFRGDPSAEILIQYLTRQNRSQPPDNSRLLKLAYLRANRPSGRDNPSLPYNFELEEKIFVPLYHRFCGEQVTLIHFGVRDLFELFDSMQETFIASGNGQDRKISLTIEARRELLERRVIDILRMTERSMTENELLQSYRRQPTMSPYFNETEIKNALLMSKLVETIPRIFGGDLYRARPIFECAPAVSLQPDVGHTLMVFMLSYDPLAIETIRSKFLARTGRYLSDNVLHHLENAGAIRLVGNHERKYDLHDVCRVVRNIVYKMNELPNKVYTVEREPYLGTNELSNREVSLASVLSFSGDFTFIDPGALHRMMCDFNICFERINDNQFKLRQELMVWVPAPEEVENGAGRRPNRGQGFRPTTRRRQPPRDQRHHGTYRRPGRGPGGGNGH